MVSFDGNRGDVTPGAACADGTAMTPPGFSAPGAKPPTARKRYGGPPGRGTSPKNTRENAPSTDRKVPADASKTSTVGAKSRTSPKPTAEPVTPPSTSTSPPGSGTRWWSALATGTEAPESGAGQLDAPWGYTVTRMS